MNAGEDAKAGDNTPDTVKPKSTRRSLLKRWYVIVPLIVVLAIVVVLALAPYLASTGAGTNFIAGQVNSRILGNVKMGDLSTGWGGPTVVRGLEVRDPQGRVVLQADELVYSGGAWQMAREAMEFRSLEVQAPRVTLYVSEDNEISLVKALELREPSPPEPTEPFKQAKDIRIHGGVIKVIRADGSEYALKDLEVTALVKTPKDFSVKTSVVSPEGSTIAGDFTLADFGTSREELQRADIKGTLRSDKPVQLAPILAVAGLKGAAGGQAGIDLTADVTDGQGNIKLRTQVKQLSAGDKDNRGKPMDVTLEGDARFTTKRIEGTIRLVSDPGTIDGKFAYALGDSPQGNDDYLSALLTGKQVALPPAEFAGSVKLDLVRLHQALPGVLPLREGVQLTQGRIDIPNLSFVGGSKPTASGKLTISEILGRRANRDVRLEPITSEFDLSIVEGTGASIKNVELKSAFAEFQAKGTPADFSAKYNSNLSKLIEQAGQIFDTGDLTLQGSVNGTLTMKRQQNEKIGVTLAVKGEGVRATWEDNILELPNGELTQEGVATLQEQKLARYDMTSQGLALGDVITMNSRGWYDHQKKAFDLRATVDKSSLAAAGRLVAGLGTHELRRYSGNATAELHVRCQGQDKPIVASGTAQLADVLIDKQGVQGKPLTAKLTLGDTRIAADMARVQMPLLELTSSVGNATVSDVDLRAGKQVQVAGKYKADGDVSKIMALMQRINPPEPAKGSQPPKDQLEASGQLAGSGNIATEAGVIRADGTWTVTDVVLRSGQQDWSDKQVKFAYNLQVDQPAKIVTLHQTQLDSRLLTASVVGEIREYDARRLLNLNVKWSGSWKDITELLHKLEPSTADTIAFSGKPAEEFRIIGPAHAAEVTPVYRGVESSPAIPWETASLYGLDFKQARLTPRLKDGRVYLPPTVVPGTAGGQMNLTGTVDLTKDPAVLTMPGKVTVLENLEIDEKVGKHILSRANPLLGEVTDMRGRVTLVTEDMNLPLGEQVKTTGSGRGKLDLSELKVTPRGALGDLMRLMGVGLTGNVLMRVSSVDFVIRNGRVQYDNFTITVGGMPLKFRGAVGFDDKVDMAVSVPVTEQLLGALKVKGPIGELTKRLQGSNVEIPIRGTRTAPKLDMSAVNIKPMIDKALRDIVKPPKLPKLLNVLPAEDPNAAR